MNENLSTEYKPGEYGKKRLSAAAWADVNIRRWNRASEHAVQDIESTELFPCICISRQIGAGALEIADLLSEVIHYRVADREILEYMAKERKLSEKAVAFFDERYPGKMSEFFSMLISKKTFLKSDYARQLAKTVSALAGTESTIFVGRGTHMILPRERVLAVRLIADKAFRAERLARILNLSISQAMDQLKVIDKEQKLFFRQVYQQTGDDPKEFDLVINKKYLTDPEQAVKIIACAFEQKLKIIE